MSDGRMRAAQTIARETTDIFESLVATNGTDRAGAAATAACLTLLLTGLAGRTPVGADGQSHQSENGLQFATSVIDLLRQDVPADLHTGSDLKPQLPAYIPAEAEGHIMYGLTRLRSAIQNWTMLPGVDGPELIQAGFAGGVREFIRANRTARPNVALEIVVAIGGLIEPPRPVPQYQPQFQLPPMPAHHGQPSRMQAPHPVEMARPHGGFHFQAAARAA